MKVYKITALLLMSFQVMYAAQQPGAQRPAAQKRNKRVSFADIPATAHESTNQESRPVQAPVQHVIPVKGITVSVGDIKQPRSELIDKVQQAEFFEAVQTAAVTAIIFGKANVGQVKPSKAAFKEIRGRIKKAKSMIMLPYGYTDQQCTLLLHETKGKMCAVLNT